MKWRMKFLWMKVRPLATFVLLMAVPFLPVVPWVLAAGPDPAPLAPQGEIAIDTSLAIPIPTGAADEGSFRGPPPAPVDPAGVRRAARGWELRALDADGWNLLMSDRFAVRGNIESDDLRAVGAFAERFLDAVHERLGGDLTDLRLSIRVFAEDEEFRHWASCRDVEASRWFYDHRWGEIALLFGPGTDVSEFCTDLMRGVVHVYFDRVLGYEGPPWVGEGVAEWFADYGVSGGRVVPRRKRGDVRDLLRVDDGAGLEAAWKAWAEIPE